MCVRLDLTRAIAIDASKVVSREEVALNPTASDKGCAIERPVMRPARPAPNRYAKAGGVCPFTGSK